MKKSKLTTKIKRILLKERKVIMPVRIIIYLGIIFLISQVFVLHDYDNYNFDKISELRLESNELKRKVENFENIRIESSIKGKSNTNYPEEKERDKFSTEEIEIAGLDLLVISKQRGNVSYVKVLSESNNQFLVTDQGKFLNAKLIKLLESNVLVIEVMAGASGHCCYTYHFFEKSGINLKKIVSVNSGNSPIVFKDLDNDGKKEIISHDSSNYFFSSYRMSASPIKIFKLSSWGMYDSTAKYQKEIKIHIKELKNYLTNCLNTCNIDKADICVEGNPSVSYISSIVTEYYSIYKYNSAKKYYDKICGSSYKSGIVSFQQMIETAKKSKEYNPQKNYVNLVELENGKK